MRRSRDVMKRPSSPLACLALLAGVSGCAGEGASASPTSAPSAAAPPGGSPSPGHSTAPPAETRVLTLTPADLSVSGDAVLWKPGSRVQRARYEVYRFDRAAFEAKVGTSAPEKELVVKVEILRSEVKTGTPSDPRAPSPSGGFVVTTHEARIVSVEK